MVNLSHPAPQFSAKEAETLCKKLFNVVGIATPLDGERDRNFRLQTDSGNGWILKVVNSTEPLIESEFQASILTHLAKHSRGLVVPFLRLSDEGGYLAKVTSVAGEQHAVRLVSWLNGTPLAKVDRDFKLMRRLGQAFGELDKALQSFMHPGAVRNLDWDLRHAARSRSRLKFVQDPSKRAILERFIYRFEASVEPKLANLRAQVIHNDGNDWNVLVNLHDHTNVSGIIDFGDAVHTILVSEVAITCAYAILDMEDPIGAAAALASGFHEKFPLQPQELDVLFDLIAMRLVTSVTISASRYADKDENPYLAVSEEPAWRLLERMDRMDPKVATAIFRKACKFDAVEGASEVRRWLERNRNSFADLVRPSAATMNKVIAPWGDATHEFTIASAELRPADATNWWNEFSLKNNFSLAVGPWGEERAIYTDKAFESRLIKGARRILHIGVDLVMPEGTALYAPVAGVVRSVEVEGDPLGYGGLVMLEHTPEGCPPFLTLWGHMAQEVLSRLKPGDQLAAGDLVGFMGQDHENGGWIPHLHFQMSTDIRLTAGEFIGVGEKAYLEVWADMFPDVSALAGLPPETWVQMGRTKTQIIAKRKELLLPNLSISYSDPIKFVRGDGVWLIDDCGRAYLDCFNNVCHLGHSHPDVIAALTNQAARLNTNTRYLHDNIVEYAERLTSTLPDGLSVASFACSGSEANSLMLRMARTHTGRNEAIVLDWAYHGNTQELIDLSPYKYKRNGGKGRPEHVYEAAIPDAYHAPEHWSIDEIGKRYAESVAEQIDCMQKKGKAPAFFIAESIPSVAGQVFLPSGYLQEVYQMVRAEGGVCLADEVQIGFGRVGTNWWAFETQGVVPDAISMGKPIGNGHPMSAVITTHEIAESFNNGMEYFNTFGGNPVSCAVGLAVLNTIERDDLKSNAQRIGAYLLDGFRRLQLRYEPIGDVRGQGLFVGIELVADRKTKLPATELARRVVDEARIRGVLIGTEGPYDNVLKMRPSMIFSKANADFLLSVLDESFQVTVSAS